MFSFSDQAYSEFSHIETCEHPVDVFHGAFVLLSGTVGICRHHYAVKDNDCETAVIEGFRARKGPNAPAKACTRLLFRGQRLAIHDFLPERQPTALQICEHAEAPLEADGIDENSDEKLQDEENRHEKEDEEKEVVCWLCVMRRLQTDAQDV